MRYNTNATAKGTQDINSRVEKSTSPPYEIGYQALRTTGGLLLNARAADLKFMTKLETWILSG